MLKPFAKDFYDYIILNIIDGLGGDNWIIKNACMLLFSKLIKNNFTLDSVVQKGIPTFIEYFTNKNLLKNKILEILKKESEKSNNDCNDCLILLISFFSRLKCSKPSEINEMDLLKFLEVLFKLESKNNKVFRKTLGKVIVNFYGENQFMCYERIISYFDKLEKIIEELNLKESNDLYRKINLNSLDFYLNLIKELRITEKYFNLKKILITENTTNLSLKGTGINFDELNNSYLRKIGNKSEYDDLKFRKLNDFINEINNKIAKIFSKINDIFLNNSKNTTNISSEINNENYVINYLFLKERRSKNFTYAFLLLVKKFSKFILKSNNICKIKNHSGLFSEISESLQNKFSFNENLTNNNFHILFGKIQSNQNKNIIFDFNYLNKILSLNIKSPFFYKSFRNAFNFYHNHYSNQFAFEKENECCLKIINFDLNLVNFKNQELTLFLLKNYNRLILNKETIYEKVLFCFDNFNNKNTNNRSLAEINVNIFSKILDFFNDNVNIIQIDFELKYNLILKMLKFLEDNINVTKLIKSILISVSKLIRKCSIENSTKKEDKTFIYSLISQTLNIIQILCVASNEEKTRFFSLLSLENLIEFLILNTNKDQNVLNYLIEDKKESIEKSNLQKFLTIFMYILNDDHPEIRNFAVKIFTKFNCFVKLITLNDNKNLIKSPNNIEKENILYNSEFIFKKLLKFSQFFDTKESREIDIKSLLKLKLNFFQNTYKHNFYFSKSRSLLNNNNKIFYYEPDNRYLDNIEVEITLIKQLKKIEKSDKDSFEKFLDILNNKKDKDQPKIKNIKIMDMLENFIFYFIDNFENILFRLQENSESIIISDVNTKNLFANYRKIIY